ncbi:MAG: thiosulfate oxidation carrier protein SoxY [Burkholderiales bacterium]
MSMRPARRRWLQGTGALVLVTALPVRAADGALPAIPALDAYLAGRKPRFARLALTLPGLADNGFSVPVRLAVPGPFAPGPYVKSLRLFSEANPVPDMAVFEFPVPVERVEVDSRIRLAGTQQIVATAEMSDGTVYAAAKEVIVTLAGCMDGT